LAVANDDRWTELNAPGYVSIDRTLHLGHEISEDGRVRRLLLSGRLGGGLTHTSEDTGLGPAIDGLVST
jgi:hypothetical protein